MAHQIETPTTSEPSGILTGYRWLATIFAALIVLQAYLGTRGFVAAEDGLVTTHEMLANTMFLIVVAQTVLAWLLYTRGRLAMNVVVMNAVLVLLTIGQIGLGYSTRGDSFINTISLHIPNGVLLMGVGTVVAALAWQLDGRRETAA